MLDLSCNNIAGQVETSAGPFLLSVESSGPSFELSGPTARLSGLSIGLSGPSSGLSEPNVGLSGPSAGLCFSPPVSDSGSAPCTRVQDTRGVYRIKGIRVLPGGGGGGHIMPNSHLRCWYKLFLHISD